MEWDIDLDAVSRRKMTFDRRSCYRAGWMWTGHDAVAMTAELLLHSERVSRHVNGVEQTLSELSEGLEVLSDNQSDRVDRLVDDITRLDRLYTAANKSSTYGRLYLCRCVLSFLSNKR